MGNARVEGRGAARRPRVGHASLLGTSCDEEQAPCETHVAHTETNPIPSISDPRGARLPWLATAASLTRRLIFPPRIVTALSIPVIAVLMVWVFLLGGKDGPLSYAAYVISAYLLTVFCVWAVRSLSQKGLRNLASKHAIINRVLNDKAYRRKMGVSGGLLIDVAWAVANLVGGVYYASIWLITLGASYLLFAIMRGVLLRCMVQSGYRGSHEGGDRRVLAIERLCGALLMLSTFVLSGIVCLVMHDEGTFSYEGVLIYAVAAFAFYSLISAIVNYARLRKRGDALIIVNCRVNLAVALVSVFALEVAMLAEFGTTADAGFLYVTPIATGAAIAAVLIALGAQSLLGTRRAA